MRRVFLGSLCFLVFAFTFVACKGGGVGGGTPPSTITVSGKLFNGTVSGISAMVIGPKTVVANPTTALPGYQLYCITFASPPITGRGTSGVDGTVNVTLNVGAAAFGCFVLDANGNGVATLMFTDSNSLQSGETIEVSGSSTSVSVDLGTITVSPTLGIAAATIPNDVLIMQTGAACPTGTWKFDTGDQDPDCPTGTTTNGAVWIAETPDGKFAASFTTNDIGHKSECVTWSKSDLPMAWNGKTATAGPFDDIDNPDPCPGKTVSFTFTPDSASCTTATGTRTLKNCATCSGICGCGTLTCVHPLNVTRQLQMTY